MGHGSYTAADWAKLKTSRKLSTATTQQIFTRKSMDPRFDPKFIGVRESRDSEDHPASTPIMIGVDVTGSMGYLSTQIIKESLNELMQSLYANDFVRDPQLLFAAIGDVDDDAPLQVTQFESDIRIAEQLMDLWLEGRGGDMAEDYELLWYFAARHTDVDSFNKRGQKGFCITIGDAGCHKTLSMEDVKTIFDDACRSSLSSEKLAAEASEKYELFHINIGPANADLERLLPGRVLNIEKSDVRSLPEILISVMQISRGKDRNDVIAQWDKMTRPIVQNAVSKLCVDAGRTVTL